MESRHGRRGQLVALVASATVAVIGVVLSGPFRVGERAERPVPLPAATHAVSTGAPIERPLLPRDLPAANQVAQTVVLVILGIVALSLLATLVVWVARRLRRTRVRVERVVESGIGAPASESSSDPVVSAPAVARGLVRALETLDEPGTPRDAVVRAWLGLEDAAVVAGAPRHPSETPSEYVARIIRRFDADRDAADELRGLYERVRFGGSAAEPDARSVEAARRCLTALLSSWRSSETVMK